MAGATCNIRGPHRLRPAHDGDTVVAGRYDAVGDGDVLGVRDVDSVGVGTVARRSHVNIGNNNIIAMLECDFDLLCMSYLQVPYY